MDSHASIRRRELLVSGGIAAAVLTAGCSGGGEEPEGTEGDDTTPSGDDESPTTDEEETPTETEGEGEETPDETEASAGPLTTEWATPYPDDIIDDRFAELGDFALGEQRAYVTSQNGASVIAFDLADGEILWRWEEFVNRPSPALAYHEDVGPVAVLRSQGNNGDVYALDPASGTVQWDYKREANGSLIATATDQYIVAGSGTGLTVLDPADGSVVTEFGGLDGVDFGTATKLDVDQSSAFSVDTFSNTIAAYDLETGERRWQVSDFEVEQVGELSVVVVDGIAVGTDSSTVFGIDPGTEEVTFRLDVDAFDQELVGSDTLAFFINEIDPNESVRAIDATEGTIDWEQTGVPARPTTPALAGDRLIVNSSASLTVLDTASGDIVQSEFNPNSGVDPGVDFQTVRFLGARGDRAAVTSRKAIYGLSIGN
jgi:outer membrane protein assembly factor BamB